MPGCNTHVNIQYDCLSSSTQEVSRELPGLHEDLTEMLTLCSQNVPNIILASQGRLNFLRNPYGDSTEVTGGAFT